MKMKIPEAVIDVDWDFLKEHHAGFSPQAQWMWKQLMHASLQKAIYKFREKWGIPPKSGHKNKKGSVSEVFGGYISITGNVQQSMEINEQLIRIEDSFQDILKKFAIPDEYKAQMLGFVIFGTIPIDNRAVGSIQQKRVRQAQERNRNRDSQYKKWDDIVNKPNIMPDYELIVGGVTLNIDPRTGWIIIKQDPSRPTSEISKAFPLINDFKEKSKKYFDTAKSESTGTSKTGYGFLVDLIIRDVIMENPSAENDQILTKAKLEFRTWQPNIKIEKVKELPLLVDDKFTKRVQRIRKDSVN
jgi:hypothetical protein